MKNLVFSILAVTGVLMLQSFTTLTTPVEKEVSIDNSKIVWKGYKVTGSHEGTIALKSGNLSFDGDRLTGGEFVIDMSSITCTDLSGEYQGKLEGHLKSDDFFGVEAHPTAQLNITDVKSTSKNAYQIQADLTIKGLTKSIVFPASIYGEKATANLKIDRTQFNVKYGSGSFFEGLKDNLIYDEFDLVIDVEF